MNIPLTCILSLILNAVLLTHLQAAPFSSDNSISLLSNIQQSIVTIAAVRINPDENNANIQQQSGAGVILNEQGIIATNTHILSGASRIQVILMDGQKFFAKIVHIGSADDISLIKIESNSPLPTITWGDSNHLHLNQTVFSIGHSTILNRTISQGSINALLFDNKDLSKQPRFLQINQDMYHGDSGGAVFNQEGQLIGLITAKRLQHDKTTLAVASNTIRLLLNQYQTTH